MDNVDILETIKSQLEEAYKKVARQYKALEAGMDADVVYDTLNTLEALADNIGHRISEAQDEAVDEESERLYREKHGRSFRMDWPDQNERDL